MSAFMLNMSQKGCFWYDIITNSSFSFYSIMKQWPHTYFVLLEHLTIGLLMLSIQSWLIRFWRFVSSFTPGHLCYRNPTRIFPLDRVWVHIDVEVPICIRNGFWWLKQCLPISFNNVVIECWVPRTCVTFPTTNLSRFMSLSKEQQSLNIEKHCKLYSIASLVYIMLKRICFCMPWKENTWILQGHWVLIVLHCVHWSLKKLHFSQTPYINTFVHFSTLL